MKLKGKILILFLATSIVSIAGAAVPFSADSSTGIISLESKAILQQIGVEKERIAKDYKSADSKFFRLVDSVANMLTQQRVSAARRNLYLERLQVFLENIDRYYSDSYFKSGTYYTILSYYPVLLTWDQKNELLPNLIRFSSFSVKAVRLVPDDQVAENFLTDYLLKNPDDIFRYTEEFDDRNFALRLLERAVKQAPESAKRYFTSENVTNDILSESNDPFVKKSYEIFDRYGIKSRAYLLLDAIVNNEINTEEAESIGRKPDQLFQLLVQLAMTKETHVTYSMFRYMDNYCIESLRKITPELLKSSDADEAFKSFTPGDMFVLMSYGHREFTPESFRETLEILRKKSMGAPINSILIEALDIEKLKELVAFCNKNQMLEALLGLVGTGSQDYLLGLAGQGKAKAIQPEIKALIKENPVVVKKDEAPVKKDVVLPAVAVKNEAVIKSVERPEPVKRTEPVPTMLQETITASSSNKLIISAEKKDFVRPPVSEFVGPVKITLDENTKTTMGLKKNVLQTLQNIPLFINQSYAEALLNYAAQKEPDELFKKIDAFKNNRFSKSVLEKCAVNAPVSVKRYLYNPQHPVNYILQYSTDPVVKKIFEINPDLGYHNKPLLLLDDLMNKNLSVAEAIAISSDANRLFSALVKISSRPSAIGKYSIDHEMRDYSLRFIREINDKIAAGAAQPFSTVESFSSGDLYFLMLYGRDEVFTSTFTGLFYRFMQRLPNHNGEAFFESVSHNQFRDFLSLCSNFGTLEELLSEFSASAKAKLLISYTSNLETERDDLSTVVLIAEAISNLTDIQLLTLLQTNIKKEFLRVKSANDQVGISIYGVLSSMISGNAKVETSWYEQVSERFKISPVSSLATESLFNESNDCVEQMYFYNDEDGQSSFINFLNTYKAQPAWVIEDHKNYVRIYSKQGKRIEIFANKPESDEEGINSIGAFLKENKITPSVIIHRGHSFHTASTLEKIPSSAKLIFVGSCGGFYKISIALKNAPEAHIIATKQVGTKSINDAMLFALNETIRGDRDIVWNDFWDKMREKIGNNQYFCDYIPPNKNLEAIFIRAYYKILGV